MDTYTDDLPQTMQGTSLAVQMAQAELNQSVTTARAFPRSLSRAKNNIMSLVLLDEDTAAECIYVLPRAGKPVKGPSIRFAEIVASMYGNCHIGARVVAVDRFEKVVIAEGVFVDLETGMKQTAQIQRRIVDRNGKLYNDDMIAMTGNAAMAIARRNAILTSVPKAIWRAAFEAVDGVVLGKSGAGLLLSQRREKALQAFAQFGVTPARLFALLEVHGADDVQLDDIVTLTAIFRAIKAGEATVETYFPPATPATGAVKPDVAAKLSELARRGGVSASATAARVAPPTPAATPAAPADAAAADPTDEDDDGLIEREDAGDGAAAAKAAEAAAEAATKAAGLAARRAKAAAARAAAEAQAAADAEAAEAQAAAEADEADEADEAAESQPGEGPDRMMALHDMIAAELENGARMFDINAIYVDQLERLSAERPELMARIDALAIELGA